jgi:hypothetical protein
MSSVEPDVQDFLKRIVWSVSLVLVYLLIISTAGIAAGWFFFDVSPTTGNYIFYGWIALSTFFTFRLLARWWRQKYPHG